MSNHGSTFKDIQNRFNENPPVFKKPPLLQKPVLAAKPKLKPDVGVKPIKELEADVSSTKQRNIKPIPISSGDVSRNNSITNNPPSSPKQPCIPLEKSLSMFQLRNNLEHTLGKSLNRNRSDLPPPPVVSDDQNSLDDFPLPPPPPDPELEVKHENRTEQSNNYMIQHTADKSILKMLPNEDERNELVITLDRFTYRVITVKDDEGSPPYRPERPSWVTLTSKRVPSTCDEDIYDDAESSTLCSQNINTFIPTKVKSDHTLPEDMEEIYDDAESSVQALSLLPPVQNLASNDDDEIYDDAESSFAQGVQAISLLPSAQNLASNDDEIYDDAETLHLTDRDVQSRAAAKELNVKEIKGKKEEQDKRLKEEKKRKEREEKKLLDEQKKQVKEEKKRKKRLKIKGNEQIINVGKVKISDGGGKLELPIKKDETLYLIRLDNNPSGLFLVQNLAGQYGYVKIENLDIDENILRNTSLESPYSNTAFNPIVGFQASQSSSKSDSIEEEYEDIDSISGLCTTLKLDNCDEFDDSIYEEC